MSHHRAGSPGSLSGAGVAVTSQHLSRQGEARHPSSLIAVSVMPMSSGCGSSLFQGVFGPEGVSGSPFFLDGLNIFNFGAWGQPENL